MAAKTNLVRADCVLASKKTEDRAVAVDVLLESLDITVGEFIQVLAPPTRAS